MPGQIGKLRLDEVQPAAIGGNHRLAAGDRGRIAIERNDVGTLVKNGLGITAGAKGSVENDLAGRWFQRGNDFAKQDRDVTLRSAIGIRRSPARIRRHSVSPSYAGRAAEKPRPALASACAARNAFGCQS